MAGFWNFIHLLGMAMWLGGMFTLSIFTARARRTDDVQVVAFAYSTAARLYRFVVAGGAVLTILAGVVLMFVRGWAWFVPFPRHWLFQMEILGIIVLLVTLLYVLPNSGALARLAERGREEGRSLPEFDRRVKRQAIVGSAVGGVLIYLILLGAIRF